jgi:transposase InsO family protein
MSEVYHITGLSKQAVHQHIKRLEEFNQKLSGLVVEVDELRSEHPGCGVEKMYYTLQPEWLGRDKFIEIFMHMGYRLKRIKNFKKTTIPIYSKYQNLIQGLQVFRKNQVWQSDITYFQVGNRYYYIVFITDVYTKRIIGYQVNDHLRAEANLSALKMAIKHSKGSLEGLIHHSDRGSQYIDNRYIKLLEENSIQISMGKKAQDNAYAERINGTIKNEYLKYKKIQSLKELQNEVNKAVKHYNTKRKHRALIGWKTPIEFENYLINLDNRRRPKVIIYAEGNSKIKEALSLLDFKPEEEPKAHNCPIVI